MVRNFCGALSMARNFWCVICLESAMEAPGCCQHNSDTESLGLVSK